MRGGALADRALDRALDRIPERDRPWTQELVYGTLRLRGRLDALLGRHVRRGLGSLEPDILDVLRLGAYQILEMGSVPTYAAVSQSVEQAKAVSGRGAGGLVNGVLKALAKAPAPESVPADPADALATLGSHPRWLVERWVARWGPESARALVEADNQRPELFIRPVGVGVDDALDRLETAGVEAERVAFAPDSLRILPPAGAAEALAAVPAVVQDPAAALVARYAAVPEGARVADLCAAPGGKAMELAAGSRYVVAADPSLERLGRVRENRERLGRGDVGLVVADARRPPIRPVDAVLVDAPCTGTGTFRRHPDGKWRITPADLEALARLQSEILDGAAESVAPGGLLVYSTCSLEPEENQAQVERFLERHPEFHLEATPAELDPGLLDDAGRLVVLPQRYGVDGAFAARLRRRT